MQLTFNSIEEVREFIKGLKGTRGGKGGDADDGPAAGTGTNAAPVPLQPPAGQQAAFQAPQGGFPGVGQFSMPSGIAPEVQAIVTRIGARIDAAIASGQPADQCLAWFRGQCGSEASQATMDQIKGHFLPKLPMGTLDQIAKMMNA